MTDTTARGAGPAARAHHAGEAGPVPERRRRMSAKRKQSAVLRLLRGEDLELVSRKLGVTAARDVRRRSLVPLEDSPRPRAARRPGREPARSMRLIEECRCPKSGLQRGLGSPHQADNHVGARKGGGSPPPCSSGLAAANAPGSLMWFQVVSIQPSERWTWVIRNSSIWPLKGSAMPLTCCPMPSAAELRSVRSVSLICATRAPFR
jgi:hypothetical protein